MWRLPCWALLRNRQLKIQYHYVSVSFGQRNLDMRYEICNHCKDVQAEQPYSGMTSAMTSVKREVRRLKPAPETRESNDQIERRRKRQDKCQCTLIVEGGYLVPLEDFAVPVKKLPAPSTAVKTLLRDNSRVSRTPPKNHKNCEQRIDLIRSYARQPRLRLCCDLA